MRLKMKLSLKVNMRYLFFFTFLLSLNALALSVPALTTPVVDEAKVLTVLEKKELNLRLHEINDQGLIQIGVLLVDSLEDSDLETFSIKVAETWQLGTKEKDNGLIILLVMKEKKIRIEVGNGIEGEITDYLSRTIISDMGSLMRNGEIKNALMTAINTIHSKMEETLPENIAAREEAERVAELRRAESEQARALQIAKVKELFLNLTTILLFITAGGLIINSLLTTKRISQTKEATKQEELSHRELKNKIQTETKIFASLKLDPTKYNFALLQEKKSTMESQKRKLISDINEMKRYLGAY